MKPTANSQPNALLGLRSPSGRHRVCLRRVIAAGDTGGRSAHFVICSRGESATHGTPAQRSLKRKNRRRFLGRRLRLLIWMGMLIWKFGRVTRLSWRKLCGEFGRASCWRRVWLRTSIPIIHNLDDWCGMRRGLLDMGAWRNCGASTATCD